MRRRQVLTSLAVMGVLAIVACGGGTSAPAAKPSATASESAASAPSQPTATPPSQPAATAPSQPASAPASKPVKLVAVVGADGHGKSTLLSAIAKALGEPAGGSRRSFEEVKLGNKYSLSFEAGDRTIQLKEYPTHAEAVAALGDTKAGLAGLVLVVEQASGIVKQTREQIQAAGKGGVRPLAVAQTKDDLVDDAELKDLEQGEIEQALVDNKLLAERDAGTWEGGKFKPGKGLAFVRVSARRALAGDAKARQAVLRLIAEIEKKAAAR